MSTIFGLMRIKNEGAWIQQVVESILPVCERVFILDDHSTDGTDEICERMGQRVTVLRSPFKGLDEARDKEFLLDRVMGCVSDIHLRGNPKSPFWALAIDGDEVLDAGGIPPLLDALDNGQAHAYKLPILYLWDSRLCDIEKPGQRRVRVDGVYRHFARPSVFRLFNSAFRFQRTPWGGNFHCSSIPQELLHCSDTVIQSAPIWHLGYNDVGVRLKKYAWYTTTDPNNPSEDNYRHIVQGDIPEVPADMRLLHAGPMEFEMR